MIKFLGTLTGLLASATLATAAAQDLLPVSSIHYAGRYDVATHTFFPSDIDPDLSPGDSNPTVLYDNSTTNMSYWAGNQDVQYSMDWGTPTFGGSGATITEIKIGYATELTALQNIRIRLHQGATGFGNKGTEVFNELITGLPGSTVAGQGQAFTVDVTLATPLVLADGPLGWSYFSGNTKTGPLTIGPPNGAGVVNNFDRYNNATGIYKGTFQFTGGVPMASFMMRLKGRASGNGAWTLYGTKKKVDLSATGSGTPGSVDNVITIKNNPGGKSVILVAGLVQSDIFSVNLDLQLYAMPWIIQLAPMVTPVIDGTVNLPTPLDASLPPGTQIFLQVFGQNLSNQYKNWSEGLQLTIQ